MKGRGNKKHKIHGYHPFLYIGQSNRPHLRGNKHSVFLSLCIHHDDNDEERKEKKKYTLNKRFKQ